MPNPGFGKQIDCLVGLIERVALDMMTAQQLLDRETAALRDRYGMALINMKPKFQDFFKPIVPPRSVLSNTSIDINVLIGTRHSVSGGLNLKLLNAIEVAGFKSGRESRRRIGSRLHFDFEQIPNHGHQQERSNKNERDI